MPRINIISDIDREYIMEERKTKTDSKNKKKTEKTIKIDDNLFDIALRKGLIEKTSEGYLFIGDYEDLLAFRTRRKQSLI
jgi:hypothetical protein